MTESSGRSNEYGSAAVLPSRACSDSNSSCALALRSRLDPDGVAVCRISPAAAGTPAGLLRPPSWTRWDEWDEAELYEAGRLLRRELANRGVGASSTLCWSASVARSGELVGCTAGVTRAGGDSSTVASCVLPLAGVGGVDGEVERASGDRVLVSVALVPRVGSRGLLAEQKLSAGEREEQGQTIGNSARPPGRGHLSHHAGTKEPHLILKMVSPRTGG
mgnify:FL=1